MQTLLLIDAGLADLDILMSGLNPGVVPFVVEPDQDALAVLETALSTTQTFEALALVAHGNPGEVLIGREPITKASLSNRSATWASLTGSSIGSIHLFACHAGQDQAFLDGLSTITGCDVAAADKTVGHANLGAVWQLDIASSPRFGSLQAKAVNGLVPFTRAAQASWLHALATYYVGTPTSGNGDGSSGNPWNQTGFNAATITTSGNTLSIASGVTLTSTTSKLAGITVSGAGNLSLTSYSNQDISLINPGGTLAIATLAGASLTSANLPTLVDSLVLGGAATANANIFSDLTTAGQFGNSGRNFDVNGKTLTLQNWTGQQIGSLKDTAGAGIINVTAGNNFTGGSLRLGDIDSLTIPAGVSGALTGTFPDLAANGFVINGALRTISPADVATMAAYINGTGSLTLTGYTTEDLSGLPNSLTVGVTTSTGAVLDSTKLAPVDSITIGAGTATGTSTAIDALGPANITVATGATLNISGYTTETLGGMTNSGTINVTTANGAVLNATKLADSTSITIAAGTTASSTGTAIDTLGPSSITVTGATLNISDTAANLAASSTAALTLGSSVAVTGTTAAAADLNTTDGKISVALNAASVTTLTGTAAQIATAISASTINTASNVGVTVDAGSAVATDLNTIDSNTSATVNATSVSTITGAVADVKTAIASAGINTATNYAVSLTDSSVSVTDANTVDADTSGVVTATITSGTASTLNGLTGTGNAYTLTVTDTTASASALSTLDGKTTLNVNANGVTTLTGTATEIASAISASTINTASNVGVTVDAGSAVATDLNTIDSNTSATVNATSVSTITGAVADVKTAIASAGINTATNYAVSLTDSSVSVTDANTVDADTSGVVTATITSGTVSTLNDLTGTGNAYTITVGDSSVNAADLNTLDSKTTLNVNAASVGTLTGSAVDIVTAISATTIDTAAAVIATVTGSATVAQANTIDTNTTGVVTATITETSIAALSGLNSSTGNAYTISVSDSSVDAAALNTLDGKTTVNVNAGSVGTLTGSAGDIVTAISATSIDTGAAVAVNVNSGSATVAQANSIDAQTTGVVTATISQGDLATLGSLTGTGNAYTITLSDTTAAASALNTLDGKTTVALNAASVATLTGTAADVNSAYTANTAGTITGLDNEAVTLSDTSLAATLLNTVNSNTSGVVDAASVTALSGLLADMNTAYAANATNAISGLGNETVTITNSAGTLLASDLTTAGNATSGTVTVTNGQTVTGTVAEVTAALVTADSKVVMGSASTATVSNAATAAEGAPIATTANITASFSSGISDTLANLASTGSISPNFSSIKTDQPAVVVTITDAAGGTVQAADLSAVGTATTGAVAVTNSQTVNGTADQVIAAVVTSDSKVTLNSASTLNASTYTTQDLSGVGSSFTLNVTTINGAVIDATKLATADSVTLVGTNTATAADADTLGSRLGGTATLNITSDPITATTDLSDLGSGLSLRFGGDTTTVVNGATLTVRQDQVSGYTISGTGTVAAAGTAGADTFDASGITATTNFTSLAGADSVTIAPSALGSVDVIDGGADSDTLIFSAAATVVDVAFTNVSSVEILQLAAGTNSITLGLEAEQAGITTVTGNTGADTLNLLYGTAGLTFNAGGGADTLSYSADSTAQAITLSSIASNAASGSVVNNGTDTFTGLEAIVGGSGTADSITSTSVAETLIVTGANAGTIDGFAFSGVESVNLGDGNDTGTINTGGSLSGSLNFGGWNDTLTYAGYGSAVSATLSGADTLSAITAITGGVTGVEFLTLSANNDTLTIGGSGSLSGNVDFGAGSGDNLTYAGNANAVTVSLNTDTSTAAAGATGITGTTTGFETLIGGSGSSDMLNAKGGVNTLSVASGGVTTLDTSLTVSGFERINLNAGADTATFSGAFSGIVHLGDAGDTATINDGGSVTSLVGGDETDTLNLDGANNSITVTGTGTGTAAGTTGGTTTFSGFETVNGLAGNDAFTINSASTSTITIDGGADTDSLSVASSDTAANSLTLSSAGGGTLGNVTFSGIESIALASGADTATVTTGSLSGNLNLGDGSNTLTISGTTGSIGSYTGGSGADSVTLSGGEVGGNVDLGTGSNTLLISSTSSTIGGAVTFGSGTADSLTYAGYGSAVTVNLNTATSTAVAGATGITGAVSGFESLVGGSGSDTLNATSGVNSISVASGGTTTLDSSLTVSGFETINLGASADASSDTATVSGAFSGTIDLGDGTDTATINNGGSVNSLAGGSGTDTLNLDSANQTITVTGTGAGTSAGTSGGTTTFSGFETVNGLAGDDAFTINSASTSTITIDGGTGTDSLSVASSDTAANSLTLSSAGGGTLGNVTFSGIESIALAGGADTATVTTGSLSGNLNLGDGSNSLTISGTTGSIGSYTGGTGADSFTLSGGDVGGNVDLGTGSNTLFISSTSSTIGGAVTFGSGTADSLTYAGYGSAVSSTLSGSNTLSSVTAITGGVSGVENITLSSNNDTLTIGASGSLSGNVDFGTGSDTLTYAGNANAVTVSLNSATSTAAAGATGITGTTTGFETLIGGSGITDTLNATSGVNSISVASGGTTTLDSSLTVSGFETINLGANSDASSDTATISGAFSGTIDLGAGTDTATINNGGSVTSLAGGSGTDTLNLDSANQTITVTGTAAGTSAGTTGGTTTFSGFETVNGLAGNDAFTINSASTSTITIDGGADTDSLSVAGSDTAANSLTLSSAGGGTLGGVSFANVDNVSLGSGSDSITLASGGGLVSSAPGLLADFYNESGNGAVIGSLLRSGVVLGPVNVQDETLQSLSIPSDHVYLYAQGFLTVPGTGTYNDFILSTTSDDGVRVKIDLAGTGSFSSVIDNWTTHGDVNDFSTNQSVTAGQRIPIQIEWFDSGGGATLELYYQSSSQGISRTLVPLSNLSSGTQFSSTSGILDLGSGSDSVAFQPGTFGVSSLIGGAGTDTLNYSSYGSAVTVNLATGTATGTGGISGFETVLGSAAADTITASSSGVDNLQGNAGADTFNITVAGLTSTDTIDGGADSDTLVFTDAGVITDGQFTNVTTLETVNLTGASTISAGTEASQAGIATINTGTVATTVNSTAANYDLTVNAANLADNASLTLTGSANTNDFTVTNLTGAVLASGTSGTLAVTTGDAADNAIGVTTGSGATTITANGSGDTVTTNAAALAQNTLLSFFGAARQVVTNLVGNLTGANLSGTLNVTTANAADNGISITTGSGNVVIDGGDATDTVTVTGLNTDNQTFNAQASTAKINITAGANNQTITGSNTASDTIDGGTGTDTLSYAGGSNVDVTISSYSTQAGGSTGQGTDSFSNIETLEGATGNDILRGTTSATDEVVTVTGANTGTIRDFASTGSFSFSSFEQLNLQGGNDTLTVNGNTSGVSLSGSVELGSGNNILMMEGSAGSIAALSSGTGNDTITISAGSITGALLSGDGNDTVLISSTSSTIGGNLDLGVGTGDTLSYAGYSNAVSVTLTDITSNTGSTAAAGATAITGTSTGFENLVGGSTTGDTLTDSTGNSTVAITGANSGTIDGLAFSSIENLNLSTGDDTVTVTGNGSGVSLTGSIDLGDGTNSLTMNSSAGSIASVTSGTGDDTFSISSGSVTGAVSSGNGSNKLTISGTSSSIGSYLGGTGTDSITLSGGDVVGNVSTSTGNDTVLISSTASTIGGNLNLETGDSDTLSYAGYSNAVSVTLTGIASNAGSTAGGGATAIGGIASGFESLIGGSNSGDTVTDSTGDSTIVISGSNSGTIDGMAFSAIENLSLSTGIDGVTVQTGGSLSGNLNLGDGTSNTLTMDSGAGAIGSVTANGGNDTFTINGGTVTGAVNLGDGANSLTINNTASTIGSYTGGSGIDTIDSKGGDILGAVNTGSAGDSLTLTLGATIPGAVTLGANSDSSDGNDSLSLNASSITGAVTTGSGADEVTLSATSSVNGNITLGIDGDTYTASNADTLTLNASTVTGNVTSGSGADKVGVLTTSKITGNITLGSNTDSADGADTLTVTGTSSSSKSEITGSITTGAGEDTLDLTNATIGGANQTISLGTDSNSLDGNDRLSATGTAITATITTGSGSDSLALSSGSSITGNVTLGIDGDNQAIADYPNTITDYFASSSGWTGGTIDSTNAYYGSFLGPYAAGTKTNYQDVYKSFSFNGQPATISFDFIKLDSWDGESFSAFINNTAAFSGNFFAGQGINGSSGSTNGFSWTIAPKDSLAHRGFAGWEDQTATVTIALPAGYSNLKFGFGSTLDQGISDESYGIDNFSITPSILRHNDTLSLDASSITGNVITGSGADAVSVLTGSKITGSVNLGANTDTRDSGDTLTVTGVPSGTKSVITGSITTGGGADELKFTDATIGAASQTLSLGSDNNNNDGNDSLIATRTGITATLTTGSGSDTVTLSDSSSLTGDITLGSNTDSADGGDTLTVTGTSSSSKSEITGSIATGAGADEVKFTDATIGGANQTISLGSDSNSLDGNDILSASGTTITAAITTGSGSDKIALSANSSVTGNVSLGINAENETAIDAFDSLSGWTGGVLNNSSSYFGSFLGRYGNGTKTNGQDVSKSFALSSQPATISFDFIKFDTWDGEAFTAYVNDTAAFTGSFRYGQSISSANGSTNGFNWTIAPKDSLSTHGFGGWENQTATITITLPSGYSNFNKLGFGSNLDEGISNESYGIDNLTISPIILSNDDGLTLDASSITGNVTTGTAADTVTLSNSSTITGSVSLGSNTDANDGNDSLTLSSGSKIDGNVDFGAANDTLTLSTGISSATTVTGDVAFGVGNADTLSYTGNAGPITVALDEISADAVGTATGAKASNITGNVTGFEVIVGSDYTTPTSDSVSGDAIYDNTGASLVVLTGVNIGTIDNLDFSAIENLQLRSGADTLSFQGTSGAPGSIAGRADGGGIEGATYSNGVYSGGTKIDTAIDLLDYTTYNAGGATVDLSKNQATGVYGGLEGGLISSDGSVVTETPDSSFENVDGSRFDDLIIGDNQDTQGNVLRGFGGADTIKGLAGNDIIDGGNGVGSNINDGADTIEGGDGADTIIASFGNDTISGGTSGTASDESIDTLTYSATAISSARIEGLDISLAGTDKGTVAGDANSTLSLSTFTNTYNSSINHQLITAPTNQVSKDWTQTYTDIQNLVLSEQSDILRIDSTDVNTGSIDAKGGSLDILDYSSFAAASPVLVNLSGATYSFDFDANGTIDTTVGEITITNKNSATNMMVTAASSQGGENGVTGFEAVIGGAADDAIVGNDSDNLLVGNAGDDRIAGGAGNDTIYGGTGDDYITPGEGSDYVVAGAGINTIAITSSDLAQDTFNVDPNGINVFALQGNGTSANSSSIDAPTGNWDPGSQGLDLLDGGKPVVDSSGVTVYDTIEGTATADTYQFGGVAFKNIGNVDLDAGDDTLGTAATTKGVKVNYDGGSGTDSVTLNLTFAQFAKLNASGLYVADVQNYLDNASGKTFSSSQADFTASSFETGGVAVITPGVFNALQGDPAATTFNSAYGLTTSTITSGNDVNLSASALTTSTATALSAGDIVSAFVQASGVKGSDAISVSSGGSTTGSTTASQDASAVSRTVDDRADSVLSAYGLGIDRSSFTAGDSVTLTLSGNVKADTTAESLGFVVNATGTVEAAGSRDTSLTAGDALSLSISGTAAQTVAASTVDGLALAALASRTYGIDDANLTDTSTDSVQAGADLSLQATASSSNRVTAQTVGTESLGTLTLVNNGAAATDRFTITQIGAAFPLINGDRVRFTTSNGSVQADRDYYVANVIPVTGEFQLSSEPNGDPIDVVAAGSLQAYRPAVATADAISTVTGVDLNRTSSGVQAGDSLSLRASAADAIAATATSVAGDATAGVFRLGGMDGLNLAAEVSSIQALADTVSLAGNGASLSLTATDTATLMATSADGAALTEANIQVFGAKNSASTAGDDLNLSTQAALTFSGSASSTAGSAEARSGAGAGAGVATAGVTNVLPTGSSYSVVTGLADGTQTAAADLAVEAKAATALNATASTVSGAETLSSLWTSATGNILATFDLNLNTTTSTPSFVGPQYLAAGQLVQLDTTSATATGLAANTDYAVKLLGFGAVDASNTGLTANSITMPTGITYAVNDAVRFRLNSSTAPNSSDSRYGLALGTTYYVKSVSGNTFTLSTSTGGPVIDLSADSEGPADQLVDADRFQLLTLPTAPGGSYAVAALTPGVAGATPAVSLTLPAVANAFAGSREADRTLNNSDSLNLAQVSGISGNAGLRGLIAGAQNAITAMATGVLNAVARNTANDATASAGLVAEGLSDTAITAGSAGTVKADATISAVADAATTGNNALIDNALADLTVTARGLTASNTANDISIGGVGDVQATASLAGSSSASSVVGDSDALAALKATGLEALSAGFTATIGQQGDFSAAAVVGTAAAPLLVEAISAASGDATVQAASTAIGILGSYTAPGFSSLQAGAAQGDISGSASADLNLRAIAVDGAASVSLGTADIFGIKDMALTTGADLSQVNATAVGQATLLAQTVELDATSAGSTSVRGLFSSAAAALPVSFSEDGRIGAIAQQSSFAQSISVNGNASSTLSNDSLGIGNAAIAIDGVGALDASAISHLDNRAQSVTGAASA